jgi:hypothetical protein
MQPLKIVQFLAFLGIMGLGGCANPRHLVGGVSRPSSEVVTVVLTEADLWSRAQIWENGQWVPLGNGSQVPPGRQDVIFALAREVGSLATPNVTFIKVPVSFVASAGETVTFYEAPHELKKVSSDNLVHYTITKAAGNVVEGAAK